MDDYFVARRGIDRAGLWLDSRWYGAFQQVKPIWTKDRDRFHVGGVDGTAYDKSAAETWSIRTVLEERLARIRSYIIESIPDCARALCAMEGYKEWELNIRHVLADLKPGPQATVRRTLGRLVELLECMLACPEEILGALPDQDRTKIVDSLQQCQDDQLAANVKRIRMGMETGLACLKKGIDECIKDDTERRRALGGYEKWEKQVNRSLAVLKIDLRLIVRGGLRRLSELLEGVLHWMDEELGGLSDQRRTEIADGLQQCRARIRELLQTMDDE